MSGLILARSGKLLELILARHPGVDQPEPLPRQKAGEAGVLNQDTDLDVSLLAALREVGARHERPRAVDHDAFCVQAAPRRPGFQGAPVVVDPRLTRSPGQNRRRPGKPGAPRVSRHLSPRSRHPRPATAGAARGQSARAWAAHPPWAPSEASSRPSDRVPLLPGSTLEARREIGGWRRGRAAGTPREARPCPALAIVPADGFASSRRAYGPADPCHPRVADLTAEKPAEIQQARVRERRRHGRRRGWPIDLGAFPNAGWRRG
jgi:hypothetical protein